MSLPKKKRRFRKIVVGGIEFNWRLNSNIEICPVPNKDNKLLVDFGWFDVWLYVDRRTPEPPAYDPTIVTPAFIRKVIEFALANNWDTAKLTLATKIIYRDNKFTII